MKSRKKSHHNPKAFRSAGRKRVSGKTGMPPGSLVHIGNKLKDSVTVFITEFNESGAEQKAILNTGSFDFLDQGKNRWIEIEGLHDTGLIERLGKLLNINSMVLEDILNTEHRPKAEIQDGVLFLTFKAFSINHQNEIQNEQASFVLGNGYLVSFLESDHTWFDPVKALLKNDPAKYWQKGLDYLLYSLIDVVIDQYYEVVEKIADQLEILEDQIFENPDQELIEKIRLIKKDVITIRKASVPALEAMIKLKREETALIRKEVLPYFNDVHDHIIQILDYLDTYRELSAELKENYISNITLRMNQVMKLLTIITTIFIPLSFIAGIYGMNFMNMPELTWKYGYFIVLGIMLILGSGMLLFFRRKKWW